MYTRGAGEGRSVDLVSTDEPTCCPASWMPGNATSALAGLAVETDSEHTLRLDFKRNLIADNDLASRYSE